MDLISRCVDQRSSSEAKIALFWSLFRGRDDVYPRRFESRKTGRSGYAPACANEWVRGVCEKPRIKCAECPNRRFLPVTDDVIRWHLSGHDAEGQPFHDTSQGGGGWGPAGRPVRFELTQKGVDFLGYRTLRDLLGSLGKSSFGRHTPSSVIACDACRFPNAVAPAATRLTAPFRWNIAAYERGDEEQNACSASTAMRASQSSGR